MSGVGYPESSLVCHAKERDRQWIEAHQAGGNRIDCDRIRCRENEILHSRNHRSRSGAVSGDGAVHHREYGRVQLSLHVEEIDEHFMHVLVRIVPHFSKQAAERVLDGAGHDRMAVGLHGRQVQDLPARVDGWNLNAVREDFVQLQQGTLEAVHLPVDFGQRLEGEAMLQQHRFPSVVAASFARVGDDRFVFDRDKPASREAICQHLPDHAVDLPGLGRA